jgi:thioredoxin-related protein
MLKLARIAVLACSLGLACAGAHAQSAVSPEGRPRTLFTQTSVEQAWKSAVAAKKPLLVMFTSDNCMYCEKMLHETYRHPAIERMLAGNAETVLAHSRDYKALAQKLGVRGFPSTLLVSPEGEVLDFMEGYVDAKDFADRVYPLLNKRTARAGDPSTSVVARSTER